MLFSRHFYSDRLLLSFVFYHFNCSWLYLQCSLFIFCYNKLLRIVWDVKHWPICPFCGSFGSLSPAMCLPPRRMSANFVTFQSVNGCKTSWSGEARLVWLDRRYHILWLMLFYHHISYVMVFKGVLLYSVRFSLILT